MNDLSIHGATALIFDPTTKKIKAVLTNIGIKNGRIAEISSSAIKAQNNLDAKGLHLLPGVIDSQVHFREPGLTHKEDLESGTRSAALGGITSIFEMPNTNPSTTTVEAYNEKLSLAKDRAWVDYAFFIGAAESNIDELKNLEKLPHTPGIKIFMGSSTGSLLVDNHEHLKRIFLNGKRRVVLHSENEARLKERKHIATDSQDVRNHHIWRDELTAILSTQELLKLAVETKRPVHVLHVTTAQEMQLLAQHKHIATVEVLPQHLTLHAPDCYERLGTLAQQNPPIREKKHQDALWKAIADGTVDVIGSDHAPHTLEEKRKTYPQSPSGMPSVQTLLPVMLNHVSQNRLSLERLVELVCENPRRVFGFDDRGRIEVGLKANFTLVDLKKQKTIENKWIASKSGWTPFDGMKVQGWMTHTILNGNIIMENDELLGKAAGLPVQFLKF